MNLQGVHVVLFAVIVIAAGIAIASTSVKQNYLPEAPTPLPEVAGRSIHVSTAVSQVETPTPSLTEIPIVVPRVFNASVSVTTPPSTPTPTLTPTPTKTTEGNWTVSDSGKDSNPRTAGISYESGDGKTTSSVNVTQSVGGSGSAEQHMNIEVTVNGETRELKD